jgi:ubiquinone/menaquinone biosynthesis C-methylase UbiE
MLTIWKTISTMKLLNSIQSFFKEGTHVEEKSGYLATPIQNPSQGTLDNAFYFNNPEWAEEYLKYCHRSDTFKSRWSAALGNLENKIVVDIGCGPGNIFATVEQRPKALIGVDVAATSLKLARQFGYTPVLADATRLPFISGFADVVTLNATLHHCDDMEVILREAARLVKPGGKIITDHDPQLSAWNYKGAARLLWVSRLLIYKIMGQGFHKSSKQQLAALASEIHHKPGHGVTKELFTDILTPLGFTINIYPHNHDLGDELFEGVQGKAQFKYRMGNILSGRNPKAEQSALSLMLFGRKELI